MNSDPAKPDPPANSRSRGSADNVTVEQLWFRPVDAKTWPGFALLFEERGGPKSCWCMVWRASPEEATRKDGTSRRIQISSRVEKGVPIGLLGYVNDRPIAWCSIAPRETYRPLGGTKGPDGERVWSLVCMFIKREYRGKGLTIQVIEAAVSHARAHGATSVEAYPVERDSPSYRFMGFTDVFAAAGFREVGRAGQRRFVMRRDV